MGRLRPGGLGRVGRLLQKPGRLVRLIGGGPQVLQREIHADAGILPEVLQVRDHGIRRGVALVDVLGHGLHADELQGLRDVGIDLPGGQGDGA